MHGITDTYQSGLSPEVMIGKSGYHENSQHQAFFHVTPLLFDAIASVRNPTSPVRPARFKDPSSGACAVIDDKVF
jgi:hypothetical protein